MGGKRSKGPAIQWWSSGKKGKEVGGRERKREGGAEC